LEEGGSVPLKHDRKSASEYLYTRAELHGTELWGTGTCIDHSTVPNGLYCYDLYSTGDVSDEGNLFISKEQREGATEGAVLCTEPLPFHERDALSAQGINIFENEYMWKLDEIVDPALRQEEQKEQISYQTQTEEENQGFVDKSAETRE